MYDLSHGPPKWGKFRFLGTIVLNVLLSIHILINIV